jgi:Iron-containing redox enzyme
VTPPAVTTAGTGSESERLHRKIGLLLPALTAASRRIVAHPRLRDVYPEFLFTSHCIIRASVPVMEAAKSRAEAIADGDRVAAILAHYLEQHIDEELHHDDWVLDDLDVVGVDRASVLARPPSPTVAALVGAQYYWILHYHPVSVLGYVALLEGYPPSPDMIAEMRADTGYPPEAFRTLIAHAELDPGHREELDRVLDSLPLTPDQTASMGLSAMSSARLLTQAYDEISADF